MVLMQRPAPSVSPDLASPFHFFWLDTGRVQINVAQDNVLDLTTIVENHLRLPSQGPSSIRTFHYVTNPPPLDGNSHNVNIMELREDADHRLMNDDVLCLYQITIQHPDRTNDADTRFRVMWTPTTASRDRILFHLRSADLCRTHTCLLFINQVLWREEDSVIRHFLDGDFIHLKVHVKDGNSVTATRCDFRGYERAERDRRVFIGSTSSEQSPTEEDLTSPERSRSRSRHENQEESEEESAQPILPPEQESDDDPSLLQLKRSVHIPRILALAELLPQTSVITCDFSPVAQARQLLQDLPWILCEPSEIAFPGTCFEAVQPYLVPWNHETPISYHLYTDGSFRKNTPDVGGCGLILIVNTALGPLCGGVLCRTCLPSSNAHTSETIAMLWATIVAFQLSEAHQKQHPETPFHLEFGFDADVTGHQSAGHWTSFKHPDLQRLTRNLVYVLQNRHGTHIRAHQGHCWNEIADMLAKQAITWKDATQSSDLIYAILDQARLMQAFDWIWAYELMARQDPTMPRMFGDHLYHLRTPIDNDVSFHCHFGCAQPTPEMSKAETVTLNLQVATLNVLTLETRKDRHYGTGSTGRHLSLLKQCHEKGLHLVGVQETRAAKVTNRNNAWYFIVSAPCRPDGHFGTQIWLHRQLPLGQDSRPFVEDDYRIVWSSYNVLAIRIRHPDLHCIVISARAPTADKTDETLRAFWSDLTCKILDRYPGWRIILLCDSNSHVGSCSSTSISNCGMEVENEAGEIFHQWILKHDIWLPSTWEGIHKGAHHTYVTPAGQHSHRLDFIGLSHNWPLDFVATEVAKDIDASLARCDHFAVSCTFTATLPTPAAKLSTQRRSPPIDHGATAHYLRSCPQAFSTMDHVSWTTDVHQHAAGLAESTLNCLHQALPVTKRQPRKRHLSALTWNIILWKRRLRWHHLDACRRRRFGAMREFLYLWKAVCKGTTRDITSCCHWEKWLDIKIALLEHNLDRVQPVVQGMIRQEDADYYTMLAERAGRVEGEDGLHGLWKEIRSTLPKWKARRSLQRHDIDDDLCKHFAKLETGTTATFRDLHQRCVQLQNSKISGHQEPQCYDLCDLPSLYEVEKVCRKTTPARAAGLDHIPPEVCRAGAAGISIHLHNIIMKICCEQSEPIWYKGGLIHPIYKSKGPLDDPTSYRGVVLLDVFGKKFHAWLRSRLVPILQSRKGRGQLGGLPCEQTMTGAHVVRVHGQMARMLRMSSAVIFVDVRAAFHHMLRELIFLHGPTDLDLQQALHPEHFDLETLWQLLQARCQSMPEDFPAPLRYLADDVHRHTWFVNGTTLGPDQVISTTRGTRPGSPVADVGFNLLMSDILEELQQRLESDDFISHHTASFPVPTPPITWVDDLAVPLATDHPSTLEPTIQKVMEHIHEVFYSRGLQINYDKGKTEAVLMFRGDDADLHRRRFFSIDQEARVVSSTATHVFSVRAVPSYKHLGIRFQMDADIDHEIQCRSAQARVSFHELRRPIFANKAITTGARFQLLQSLVFSKLLYGCGGWYSIPRRTVQKIDSLLMKFYRSVLNTGFWSSTRSTDDELRAQHGLPSFRVVLATARLRYLRHVATHGHEFHRQLLLEERGRNSGWLMEVEEDLTWMRTCVDLPTLPDTPDTVDTWQTFLQWLRDEKTSWKTWIKRALRTHHQREEMSQECIAFHKQAMAILEQHGAVLHSPLPEVPSLPLHACPECAMTFSTSTGVAVHRAKKHGIHSPLKAFVQSPVCPGCLKHMWTTQRVIQHLRYRPNRCLDRLIANKVPQEHVMVGLPDHLQKVKRLPATRSHHGPLLPLPLEKERVVLRERLRECEEKGARLDYWSPVNPALQEVASKRFAEAAERWLQTNPEEGSELYAGLLEAAGRLPFTQIVQEKCLIKWIEQEMWDACADWPPNALETLEKEHLQVLHVLSIWILKTERDELRRMTQKPLDLAQEDPVPFAPVPHPKKQRRALTVRMQYMEMEQTEALWRATTMVTLPSLRPTRCPRPIQQRTHFIMHLYSGRRRHADLQWHLEQMMGDGIRDIKVLSIDTAVHSACDVNDGTTWQHLYRLAESGLLLAIVLGPPCETWSAARHEAIVDALGNVIPGPRPLRSDLRPWGLDGITPRELRQLRIGMRLLMRGLILSILTVFSGGAAVLEHPASSDKAGRPSIWKTAIVHLLLQTGYFKRYTFSQWRYGSPGVKPTTLLFGGVSALPQIMKSFEDATLSKPTRPLLGRDPVTGAFCTSAAKEYPDLMNKALAASIISQITDFDGTTDDVPRHPEWLPEDTLTFLNSLQMASSNIDASRSFLPDYQGR